MAKKQTRRSVSIRGATYEAIRRYCEQSGVSMSEFVEERIAAFFGGAQPVAAKEAPRAKAPEAAAKKPEPVRSAKPEPTREPTRKAESAQKRSESARSASMPGPTPAAPASQARVAAGADRLGFDELHDAARHFTF